jgi:hypothetical protein
MEMTMKSRIVFTIPRVLMAMLAAAVLGLAGCLITGEAVGDDGLLFFGSLSVDNDRGILVIPETPRWHYHRIRIAASYYPVLVNRIVIVYRDGGEDSYAVGWRFSDRVPYHDLRVRSDRAVREVRVFQSPVQRNRMGGKKHERGPAGPVSFRIYGMD